MPRQTKTESKSDSDSEPGRPFASLPQRAVLLGALALLVALGALQLRTPQPAPVDVPATEFSAARAMQDLRVIAAESRAVGTPGHKKAREYLVDQVEALGLEATVHKTTVHDRFPDSPGFSAGVVQNVITRVPGTDSTGAILINAHYDSGTGGPGASDCGSCVVTALETLRAVLAGPQMRNDVIIVFSDAEEEGDLGASAFASQHPWMEDVRVAINYEAQGSGGPAFLYATNEHDAWIVSAFAEVAPHASGYSWIGALMEVYPAGQLDCDLAEYLEHGAQGLGFVYTADTIDYHTVRDSVDHIDPGSIQQEGANTLAVVRHLGQMDISNLPRGENQVFFNVWPGVVAHYSYTTATICAGLATVLLGLLIALGFRREVLDPKSLAAASTAIGVGALAAIAICIGAWVGLKRAQPAYDVILIGHYQTELLTAAFLALSVGLVGLLHVLTRRFDIENVLGAALILWGPLLWLLTLTMPAMSYIATWPLLFAMLPLAWRIFGRPATGWPYISVLVVAAVPSLVLLPATLHQAVGLINRFEGALGVPLLGALTFFVVPVLLLLLPHYELLAGRGERSRWWVTATAIALAVSLAGWGAASAGFDEDEPRPNHIAYAYDTNADEAKWVSYDRHLDEWTGTFFGVDAARGPYQTAAWGTFEAFTAPAPVAELEPPRFVSDDAESGDGSRVVSGRILVPETAREVRVNIEAPAPIRAASLDGRAIDLSSYAPAATGVLSLNYVAPPPEGIALMVTLAEQGDAPIEMVVEYSQLGLPEAPEVQTAPRPPDTMPAPSFGREATEVRRVFEL